PASTGCNATLSQRRASGLKATIASDATGTVSIMLGPRYKRCKHCITNDANIASSQIFFDFVINWMICQPPFDFLPHDRMIMGSVLQGLPSYPFGALKRCRFRHSPLQGLGGTGTALARDNRGETRRMGIIKVSVGGEPLFEWEGGREEIDNIARQLATIAAPHDAIKFAKAAAAHLAKAGHFITSRDDVEMVAIIYFIAMQPTTHPDHP